MAVAQHGQERHRIPPETAVAGILAILVEERQQRVENIEDAAKVEILLWRAGLSVADIVSLTGKNEGAVRKTIQRHGRK